MKLIIVLFIDCYLIKDTFYKERLRCYRADLIFKDHQRYYILLTLHVYSYRTSCRTVASLFFSSYLFVQRVCDQYLTIQCLSIKHVKMTSTSMPKELDMHQTSTIWPHKRVTITAAKGLLVR